VWAEVFWDAHPDGDGAITARLPASMLVPVAAMAAMVLGAGLAAGPLMDAAASVAVSITDPSAYIAAVLGEPQ
jgi:formate hydrogenlyase subunit 3/multisubunit Na+/H+ antiporter MnhD subunit